MSTCNFCNLERIKTRGKKEKLQLVKRSSASQLGGTDIYLVPEGLAIPRKIVGCSEKSNGDNFHEKFFVA